MLEPIPFWGMIEVDLPVKTYAGGKPNNVKECMNKPVAWMVAEMVFDTEEAAIAIGKTYDDEIIPLYTHPVKDKPHPKCDEACMYLCRMRELNDEEIMEIVADKYEKGHGRYIDTKLFFVEFAKAILRKAQEK